MNFIILILKLYLKFKTADELVKYFNTCGYLNPKANTGFMYIKSCPSKYILF